MIDLTEIYDDTRDLGINITEAIKKKNIYAYLHGAADLEKEFTSLFKKYGIDIQIVNKEEWSSLDSPLLFINCNEDELDRDDSNLYYLRNVKKLKTIPIAFFSDGFFIKKQNEKFSYNEILNSIKTDYGYPPTAFFMNNAEFEQNDNLINFLNLIYQNIELDNIISLLQSCKQDCIDLIMQLSEYKANEHNIEIILARNFINSSIQKKMIVLDKIIEKCISKESDFYKVAEAIQNENCKLALAKLNYTIDEIDDNPFANHQKLNYGTVMQDIKNFIAETKKSSYPEIVLKSKEFEKRYSKNSEIAILGTFSSGKTTFINTLLSINHKLKTSAAHNSAVILEINYCDSEEKERYDVEYKKEIEDFKIINNTSIHGNLIDDVALLAVSKSDISSLIKNINNSAITNYIVTVTYLDNHKTKYKGNTALNILRHLESTVKDTPDCHYRYSMLMANKQGIIIKELENAIAVSFESNLDKENESHSLANGGWNTFCENEDNIFIESPSCYLYAETVKLYVHSSFLENCSITDTPGFGSVTENHDFIANRFIQNFKGTLILMLKLDMKATNEILYKLIKQIYDIYANNGKSFESIYFLFNVFGNRCGKRETLNNNCKILIDKIHEQGFIEPKIYISNMLHYNEKIENYLTYDQFISAIQKEIQENGINRKLKTFSNDWKTYLSTVIAELEKTLQSSEEELQERQAKYEEALLIQKRLQNPNILSLDTIINKINSEINRIITFIDHCLTKKKEWKNSGDQFEDLVKNVQETFKDENYLYKTYTLACGDINDITNYKLLSHYNQKNEDDFYKFVFPAESIINLFNKLLNQSWGIFWYKTDENIDILKSRINREVNKSLKELTNNYSDMIVEYNCFLQTARNYNEKQITKYSSNEKFYKAIENTQLELDEYYTIFEKFKKIDTNLNFYIN